ncbi:MAG: TonB-dependent receptor [Ignavibacteria bacterium]
MQIYKLSHKIKFLAGILLILLFSASFSSLNAQQRTGRGTITGIIVDNNGNTPLEQAIVRVLKSKDSTLVSGAAADAQGNFSIQVPYGNYRVEVSYTGYKKFTINAVTVTPSAPDVSLKTIKLSTSDISTQEIDVEADKPTVEITADKKVINVENNMVSKGETAIDLLKRVPLVQVDNSNNVILRGDPNVTILINGKPSSMTDNLDQVPADQVKNIELITNPTAKYQAEGGAGIINIILKEDEQPGMNGKINLSAGTSDRYNGAVNLNMKKGKFTLTGNYFYNTFDRTGSSSSSLINNLGSPIYTNENDLTGNKIRFQYFKGGLEYRINDNHTLGLEGFYGSGKFTGSDYGQNSILDSVQNLSSYFTKNNFSNSTGHFIHLSLNYDGKLNKVGEDLSGNLTYSRGARDNTLNQTLQYYNSNYIQLNNTPYIENDVTNSSSYNFNSQLDYVIPFSKNSKLETGYKGVIRSSDNNFTADSLDYNTNQYNEILDVSNEFIYKEQVYALYAQYGNAFGDFSFKVGLRGEQSYDKGTLVNTNEVFSNKYLDFFPSVNLTENLIKNEQVELSYSRRINRPRYYRLNPFQNRTDPLNIVYGNPNLKPEYIDSYELNFVTTIGKTSITPSFFYRLTHDLMTQYRVLTDSNITVSTFENLTSSKSYGLDLIAGSQIFNWWNFNATLSFYNLSYDAGNVQNFSAPSGFSFTANINTSIKLPDLFNLQLFYNYQGKRYTSQGTIDPVQSMDVGISKNFFDNAFIVLLKANDIFKTQKYDSYIAGYGFVQNGTSVNNSRNLQLTLTYNFGKQENSKPKKKPNNDDEPNMNDINGE